MRILFTVWLLISFTLYGEAQRDTIPVVLLGCDTSRVMSIFQSFEPTENPNIDRVKIDTVYSEPIHTVGWFFGYEVLEWKQINDPFSVMVDERGLVVKGYWDHLCYLYDDKTRISSKVFIWMAKKR